MSEVRFLIKRMEDTMDGLINMDLSDYLELITNPDAQPPVTLHDLGDELWPYNEELLSHYADLVQVMRFDELEVKSLQDDLLKLKGRLPSEQRAFTEKLLPNLERVSWLVNSGASWLLNGEPQSRLRSDAADILSFLEEHDDREEIIEMLNKLGQAVSPKIKSGPKGYYYNLSASVWESAGVQLFLANDGDLEEIWVGLRADHFGRLVHFGPGNHIAKSGQMDNSLLKGADCAMFTKRTVLLIEPFGRKHVDDEELAGMESHFLSLIEHERRNGRNRPVYCIGVCKDLKLSSMTRLKRDIIGASSSSGRPGMDRVIVLPAKTATVLTKALERCTNVDETRQAWLDQAIELAKDANVDVVFWVAWLEQSHQVLKRNPREPVDELKKLLLEFQPKTHDGKPIPRVYTPALESI
jgi:hypothetical protein